MDARQKIEAALAAGPTEGDWELCHLNTPLSEIGAYVQKCVEASGGENYHFIRAVRADGVPVDVAHYGNGPTSNVNGYWATVTRPAAIREVLQAIASKEAELAAREAEIARLNTLINTPKTDEWMDAVRLEAAHQQERWGAEHDAGKDAQDWFWLLGYLGGKALASFIKGDRQKGLHHIVSSSAVLLNWHRNVTGQNTGMRPGIAEPAALTKQPTKD